MIKKLPFTLIKINYEGDIIECIQEVKALTGYNDEELLGKTINVLLPQFCQTDASGNDSRASHLTLFNKHQEAIDCFVNVTASTDESDFAHYYLFISPQLTTQLPSQLQSQPAVLHDFSAVPKAMEEAFWQWNLDTKHVHCSSMVMSILGFSPEIYESTTSFWKKFISRHTRIHIQTQLKAHIKKERSSLYVTQQIETPQGEQKWITLIGKISEYKQGKPYKVLGCIKDVTEHRSLLRQLQKQNNYLQLAEKMGNSGHWRFDLRDKSLYWSEGVYHIHGLSPEKYKPSADTAIDFYLPNERKKIKKHLITSIKNKQSFHYKSTIAQPFGKHIKVEAHGEVELNENGDVIGLFGLIKDIEQSEDAIEKLKLLALVNHTITVPIFFIDEKDNVVYQDLSPQLNTKKNILFNYINFTVSEYLTLKEQAKQQGQIKRKNISFDKYYSVFDLSVTYEKDEGIYIWIVNNITENFRIEQQQIISHRLALLGNTFGNVSHDINNVLGVALGAIEMLELKYSQGKLDISTYIERVKNAIDKGKNVTERLLTFTRKPSTNVTYFEPRKEIATNQYLFEQLLLNTIELSFDLDKTPCEIHFPQGEFINILLNLVLNAQDAIKEQSAHGKIHLSTKVTPEKMFEVHVQDSGVGIKQENISRIFDPFYTSKSKNTGNGIGLTNVYSMVHKHQGQIQVEGEGELGGAHFTLIFNCQLTQSSLSQQTEQMSLFSLSNKKVLVLDDEISISEFVSSIIEKEGGSATSINTKAQLLDALNQPTSFDVFITDMLLPDISGKQAISLVKEKFPHIQICSMSGYIENEKDDWQYPILYKPFDSQQLNVFLQRNI